MPRDPIKNGDSPRHRRVNTQLLQLLFNAIWTLTTSGSFANPESVFNCRQYRDFDFTDIT